MKMLYILIITIPMLFFGSIHGYAQPKECPVLSELEKTSIKDKKERRDFSSLLYDVMIRLKQTL
ncbi:MULTISPECIES: hypothetical protein [unclassified Peribacillus]|uniref:hypothetical protein n=1 Tax=unclassified Peribacillus TaxID=2675266 RepID=UPI001913FD33|nr:MULTISPECIES: hypothetical protein [unclassified Peribacillus]MBK5446794.1 hypothetical protein [Peribacillus sp. TH24]MBK5502866.1 hypothetical protein [Peribacillus sp. TH14]